MYICKYFKLHELVYPNLYNKYKDTVKEYNLWRIFDPDALITIDMLREFLDTSITINNYGFSNKPTVLFTESGLRKIDTKVGGEFSQHKFARAFDLKFNSKNWNPERLREYMREIGCFEEGFFDRPITEETKPFSLIKRIEWIPHMGWFHFDVWDDKNKNRCITIV